MVERENKPPVTITLFAAETDFLCSRQYLIALSRNGFMRLRVKFQSNEERRLREKLLTDDLPTRIIEETDGEFICAIETPDPLQIYPRLWKFQPWAEILSGADGLRERMRRDVQEALKNYAEPV